MSEEKKDCPLQHNGEYCSSRCAWYDVEHKCCAVLLVAKALAAIRKDGIVAYERA